MATIHIKNAGPISNTGTIALTPVLLVIGRQSSGKSTFLKILCFCRWLEKLLMVSDKDILSQYTHNLRFLKELKQFHRFNDSFFTEQSFIRYEGEAISIVMDDATKNVKIQRQPDFDAVKYNTKLSFIPSERNLVSAFKNIDKSYRTTENDVLFNYIFEWGEAKEGYTDKHPKRLSFSGNMAYVNVDGNDFVRLLDKDKLIPSYYASSGVQSAMPLDVMIDYFTSLVGKTASVSKHDLTNVLLRYLGKDKELTEDTLKDLANKTTYQSVQLFIEEPEQNLYPESQMKLMLNAIALLKQAASQGSRKSMLVMTTHSPYLLSTLNVLIAEAYAKEQRPDSVKLQGIIHQECLMPADSYSAYYIQKNGIFENIIDKEIAMISGVELDGVSDWVDNQIARINEVVYGEE